MENNQTPGQELEVNQPANLIVTSISSNAVNLSKILMDNIERLKDDPKYIPQAEAINSQVKSLIDLGKAEIEGLKLSAFLSHK